MSATLHIPDVAGMDAMTAALAYAAGGWYVVPVRRGTKNPGSVVGGQWHKLSSRDPKEITAWFAGTDYGIALHAGRSGAVVFDADDPGIRPSDYARVIAKLDALGTPHQSTDTAGVRRHYLVRMPEGMTVGNGESNLPTGKAGGINVRGLNGVIVVAPTPHSKADGLYAWQRTGPVPAPDAEVASWLAPAGGASVARVSNDQQRLLLEALPGGQPCAYIRTAMARVKWTEGGRDGELWTRMGELLFAGVEGHTGAGVALGWLRKQFLAVKPEAADAWGEKYPRRISEAAAKALKQGGVWPRDPCAADDMPATAIPAPPWVTAPQRSTTASDRGGAGDLFDDGRLQIKYNGTMTYWLQGEIGKGRLAGFFRRDDRLVYTPAEGEDGYVPPASGSDGPAQVATVKPPRLAALVQFAYDCFRIAKDPDTKEEYEHAEMFPLAAAVTVVSAPEACPNLRPLASVVHTPVLRRDGSILSAPGYDRSTRILHLPDPGLDVPPVPEAPTAADVRGAVALLDEMVAGFAWQGEHDKANFYGLLLTPMLRELLPPPYKMFGINAHQPGSGKTLLASVARAIHGGVMRSEMPGSEDELKKVVTSVLLTTTAPVVHIDNVTGVLRSSTLAGLLTSRVWTERVLGGQEMPELTNDRLWVLTGNNLALGGDLVRRTVNIGIDPGVPDPETRTGFAIADLEGWALANRGRLIAALLTLIRAWVVAGKPLQARQQSDGYAAWESAIGGILATAGVPGQFDVPESRAQRAGTDDEEWGVFLEALEQAFANEHFTVRDIIGKVNMMGAGDVLGRPIAFDELPAGLDTDHRKLARSLGNWIRNRSGRWASGLTIRQSPRAKTKQGVLYYVERHGGSPFHPHPLAAVASG